jgi:DNA-binding transcriptional LysR family regulator
MDTSQRVRAILSFVQTADHGSFAAAARKLGISSAAVSKNVAGLERALGVRLMNRTTRTLKLTAEGAAFLERARVALDALDAAVGSVATEGAAPGGRVRISTSGAFGRDHLMPALPGLRARYPALNVEVDFDDRRIDLVQDGYDLALRGGNIGDSSLITRAVCRLNTVLVAAPAYLARCGIPRTPEDLRNHQLIGRRFLGGALTRWGFHAADGGLVHFTPEEAALTVSAPEAQVQAAVLGMGIAQVGVHHAWVHLRAGDLKIVLAERHHPGGFEMVLQYPHRALLAPRVRVTVDYLLEAFAKDEALHVAVEALGPYRT